MIKQLQKLAQETRIAFNESQKVYVRVQGYPLTEPYSFYIKRQSINLKIKGKIFQIIDKIMQVCEKHITKQKLLQKMILSGSSCQIPLFKQNLILKIVQKYGSQIINGDKSWICRGNFLYRSSGIVVLEKSSDEILLKGDQDYSQVLVDRNSDLPVRLMKQMQFPRGQLHYVLKIIENGSIVGSYVIDSQNLQWGEHMNFIVEKQQHKSVSIYSSKYLGTVSMRGANLCKPIQINKNFKISVNQTKFN